MGTAMYTAVTGLLTHQRRMDVVANNIANVNTTGFRGARASFQDLFSQTLAGGSPPLGTFGGSNPRQVGLGVMLSGIDVNYGQGPITSTGVSSDLAIEGNGFFVLSNGSDRFYTRDGSFDLNSLGFLIDPATGLFVQGYQADANGNIDTNAIPGNIVIPLGVQTIVRSTENAILSGNLDSNAADGAIATRILTVYDSLGTPRDVTLTFTKRPQVDDGGTLYNAWTYRATYDGTEVTNVDTGAGHTGVILFDSEGNFHAEGSLTPADVFDNRATSATLTENQVIIPASLFSGSSVPTTPLEFNLNFEDVSHLAAAAGVNSDVTITNQDGYPMGVLDSYSIGDGGIINGVFTNGLRQVQGQIVLATFANLGGLERRGDNLFIETTASGLAQVGVPFSGGRGTISGGVLEGANVDLGTEFTNMIITQRGYQANARTITTADTMLQEAVNLVR